MGARNYTLRMETRTRDLGTVGELLRAREILLARASTDPLGEVLTVQGPAAETYVVKVLDVVPGLGKVAGRRLLASLGIGQFVRIAELTSEQIAAISSGVTE